ncbi:Asp-tRNA(Asn)/Glu-tRNA(Gln) amidotransferase subunit GatA [Patescibacteria group bacterium]
MTDLSQLSIKEASEALHSKKVTSVELTESCLSKIESTESQVDAFLNITKKEALADAKQADKILSSGKATKLTGVPVAIKDVLTTKGITTTAASKILENYIPPFDATAVAKLREVGAVRLGKVNCDEFAMGVSTEHSAYKITKNPWDTKRVPGGSSGGSAAAVASNEATWALGTDTGGSIRQPAAFCGCVGLKPTYGRVSRYGLVALASSLDCIGPLTKNVWDAAAVLEVISGRDEYDGTSADEEVIEYAKFVDDGIKGRTIGMPEEYFDDNLRPEIKEVTEQAIKELEKLGAKVESVKLPYTKYTVPTYYIILPAEASANLARYDGIRYGESVMRESEAKIQDLLEVYLKSRGQGFGPEVKRRIMLGTYALSSGYYDAYYLKAQKVRSLIIQDFVNVFKKVDMLVTPTTPDIAFKIGEKTKDPVQMYMEDIFTSGVNLAGLPGISIPAGFVDKMPVGLQFIGPAFGEKEILQAAYAYEQATEWHTKQAKIS